MIILEFEQAEGARLPPPESKFLPRGMLGIILLLLLFASNSMAQTFGQLYGVQSAYKLYFATMYSISCIDCVFRNVHKELSQGAWQTKIAFSQR